MLHHYLELVYAAIARAASFPTATRVLPLLPVLGYVAPVYQAVFAMSHRLLPGAFILLVLAFALYVKNKRRRLPPGPSGWPIIGNMFDVPQERPWEKYIQMSRLYGSDILSLKVLNTHIIVLNSAKSVDALLEKRSTNYSDRTSTYMIKSTCVDRVFAFTEYGEEWRLRRRVFHQYFYEGTVKQYGPQMHRYPKLLLQRLLDKPEDFLSHSRWMTGALIFNVTYGLNIVDDEDPYLRHAEESLEVLNKVCGSGLFLVDTFPILKLLPKFLAPFKRQAAEWRHHTVAMFEEPLKAVQDKMAAGTAPPSMTSALLAATDEQEDQKGYEFIVQSVAGTTFGGGQDTSSAALRTFFLAMTLYPEFQAAAQAQLDRVVGSDRLPELSDQDSLSLVTAIVYEVLRWRPILPLSIYHKSVADDEYGGYHIPAGSIVIGNTWAIFRDEEVYADPDTFNPYRYLNSDGTLNMSMPRPDAVFGFGRRICPGRYFVLRSLWLTVAHVLATFKISKHVDKFGNVVEPNGEYAGMLVWEAQSFVADVKPRSAAAAKLIRTEAFHAEGDTS